MRVSRGVKVGGISGLGLVAIVVVSLLLGVDPTIVLQQVGQSLPSSTTIEERRSEDVFPTQARQALPPGGHMG